VSVDPARARRLLEELGVPLRGGDLPESAPRTFPDGSRAGIEVAGIQGPEELGSFLGECDRLGIPGPARVIETRGFGALSEDQVRTMVARCAERGIGLVASIGPRASRSRSRYAASAHGGRLACRCWGSDQLIAALDDALRSLELGVRALLVYDEGLLAVLRDLRSRGELPEDLHLKASIALGCAHPLRARQLQDLGADSVNPVNDLPVDELAALRAALTLPLDVHVDDSREAAGADRLPELGPLVLAAAPVFLKCGSGARDPSPAGKARRLARVQEAFERALPEEELLEPGSKECSAPVRS